MKFLKFYPIFALAFALANGAALPGDYDDGDSGELVTTTINPNASAIASITTASTTTTTTTTTSTTPAPTTTTARPIEDVDPVSGQAYGYHVRVSELELDCTPTEKSVNEDVYVKRHEGSFGGQKLELFQKDQFQVWKLTYEILTVTFIFMIFSGPQVDTKIER